MNDSLPAIGVFLPSPWASACPPVAGGLWQVREFPGVPSPGGPGPSLQDRLAAGRITCAAPTEPQPIVLLDSGAGGFQFVEGSGGLADLRLVHEELGAPLVSHIANSIGWAFDQIPWPIFWRCLGSRSWIKALSSATAAAELGRFGVPQVIHVPAAAVNRPYPTGSLSVLPGMTPVSFVGPAGGGLFAPGRQARTAGLVKPIIVQSAQSDSGALSFAEVFYDLYRLADPPQPDDDPSVAEAKAREYFAARLFYEAGLAIRQRDRFVICLVRMLGSQFHPYGAGWEQLYGIPARPGPETEDQRIEHYRQTAVNIALGDGSFDDGPNGHHFEITAAGGFMLCYRQPGVEEVWRPGIECDTFRHEQELLEKIRYYLAHDQQRADIALAGQRRTLSEHLYSHRLPAILERADEVRAARSRRTEAARPTEVAATPGAASWAVPFAGKPACDSTARPPTLLVLQNPGRFTRYYLAQMEAASRRLGIRTLVYELSAMLQRAPQERAAATAEMEGWLRRENVRAAIGSGINDTTEWNWVIGPDGAPQSLFDRLGIDHLLWWTDHPQWANEKAALREDLQPLLRGGRKFHFVKSEVHARELGEILGWENCFGLPVAEDPEFVRPDPEAVPEYDVVAILGCPPRPIAELEPFLEQDEPDVEAIHAIVAEQALARLGQLWEAAASAELRPALSALGQDWVDRRRRDHRTAGFHHFRQLADDHAEASRWLLEHHRTYFDAAEIVWSFLGWQRTFILSYLARHFRVAVFGHDWSSRGIPGGGWVDHCEQGRFYARGKIAINISQGNEEEGASHKPFQIAASGVAQVHIDRVGLSDYFEPGKEIELFETPGQARRVIAELLGDDDRRRALADAARERLLRDHTWDVRLRQMFDLAGIDWSAPSPSAPPALEPAWVGT